MAPFPQNYGIHWNSLLEIDESIRLRHDHRHHLQTIFFYLEQNKVADAILQYYKTQCLSRDIQFECVASLPADTGIPDTDFSILLGNEKRNNFIPPNIRVKGLEQIRPESLWKNTRVPLTLKIQKRNFLYLLYCHFHPLYNPVPEFILF